MSGITGSLSSGAAGVLMSFKYIQRLMKDPENQILSQKLLTEVGVLFNSRDYTPLPFAEPPKNVRAAALCVCAK